MRNRKGLALIEVMIAIAIIGIVLAVAIPNCTKSGKRYRQQVVQQIDTPSQSESCRAIEVTLEDNTVQYFETSHIQTSSEWVNVLRADGSAIMATFPKNRVKMIKEIR
jgi:prepilin-type N-terminal cleavage/methylation domain-containing protein